MSNRSGRPQSARRARAADEDPPRRAGRPRASEVADGIQARERILTEAAQLFRAVGYSATTTRDIAAAAGIRQPTLFHYFAKKDDILFTLLQTSLDGILTAGRWLEADQTPSDVGLWSLIWHDTHTLCADPLSVASLIRLPRGQVEKFDPIRRKRSELEAFYRTFIREGKSTGSFIDRDTSMLSNLLFSLTEGTVDWFERDGPTTAHDAATEVADCALRMIVVDPQRLPAIASHGREALDRFYETSAPPTHAKTR